jgi:hypothetical protein
MDEIGIILPEKVWRLIPSSSLILSEITLKGSKLFTVKVRYNDLDT